MNWDLSKLINDEIITIIVMDSLMQRVVDKPDSFQRVVDYFFEKYISIEDGDTSDGWSNYNAIQRKKQAGTDTAQSYIATESLYG